MAGHRVETGGQQVARHRSLEYWCSYRTAPRERFKSRNRIKSTRSAPPPTSGCRSSRQTSRRHWCCYRSSEPRRRSSGRGAIPFPRSRRPFPPLLTIVNLLRLCRPFAHPLTPFLLLAPHAPCHRYAGEPYSHRARFEESNVNSLELQQVCPAALESVGRWHPPPVPASAGTIVLVRPTTRPHPPRYPRQTTVVLGALGDSC